ncbi:uncharacterized protein DUF45 [Halanaerobium sp. MA284_MarDTE_T2]|nr:uncharacterized protein DUF45 [Halanaerobium sp. MA284_MarDTE_T2]
MAPMSIVDYMLVHELMHLIPTNHSRVFWATGAAIIPDIKETRMA